MEPKNLKLIAKTEEDLRVVSAHLQDSIASISDIANLKKNKMNYDVIVLGSRNTCFAIFSIRIKRQRSFISSPKIKWSKQSITNRTLLIEII